MEFHVLLCNTVNVCPEIIKGCSKSDLKVSHATLGTGGLAMTGDFHLQESTKLRLAHNDLNLSWHDHCGAQRKDAEKLMNHPFFVPLCLCVKI